MKLSVEQEILDVDLDPRRVDIVWADWDMFEDIHSYEPCPAFENDWWHWHHDAMPSLPNQVMLSFVPEDPTEHEAREVLDWLHPAGYVLD